jgi:hypothetical protein
LDGTWVTEEVRLADAKGYKILEILEIYHFEVTQYNLQTGNGAFCRGHKHVS